MKGIIYACLLLLSPIATAQIYKCSDASGNVSFQAQPCSGDVQNSEKIEINLYRPSEAELERANSINQQNKSMNRISDLERERKNLQRYNLELDRDIVGYRQKMEAELQALRDKKQLAANNRAGAEWESSISQEMSAVTDKYRIEIDNANHRIQSNNQRIRELDKQLNP